MAEHGSVAESTDPITVSSGQSIQIQVLNADGTVASTIGPIALPIPSGQTLSVIASFSGTL